MIVTNKIHMDLQHPDIPQTIHAVQDDRYSRNLEISLYAGDKPWDFPRGASVLIRYSKADNTGGKYNLLPDGTPAWTSNGNILTIALAPQVLTAPGIVMLDIMLYAGEKRISTFPILLKVTGTVGTGQAGSENYVNMDAKVITNALGYTPVNPANICLGIHTDGLLYLFLNGAPVGTGILITGGGSTTPENPAAALGKAILDYAILA